MTDPEQPPVTITLPKNMYRKVGQHITREYGCNLQDMVDSYPNQAYEVLGKTLVAVIMDGLTTTIDGTTGVSVDIKQDGPEAFKQYSERKIRGGFTPAIEIEPREVVVMTTQNRTLTSVLKRETPSAEEVLRFTVDPGDWNR